MVLLPLAVVVAALSGATVEGRVSGPKGQLAGATVQAFTDPVRYAYPCAKKSIEGCFCPESIDGLLAQLAKRPRSSVPASTVKTGPDGGFRIEVPKVEKTVLVATSADGTHVALYQLERPGKVVLALEPERLQEVKVKAPEGIKPVLFMYDAVTGQVSGPRRVEGEVATFGPAFHPFQRVVAAAPGYAAAEAQLVPTNSMTPTAPPVLTLEGNGVVRGRVLSDGRPVEGAEITLGSEECAASGRTGADGRFSLQSPRGVSDEIEVFVQKGRARARKIALPRKDLELTLESTARVEISFVGPKGAIANLRVEGLRTAEGERSTFLEGTTDARGLWILGDMLPGKITLERPSGFAFADRCVVEVGGSERVAARVRLEKSVAIKGRVVDGRGRPVKASVKAFFAEEVQPKFGTDVKEALQKIDAGTDASGKFTLDGLLPGPYEVVASGFNQEEGSAVVQAPGEVTITTSGGRILCQGVVVDSAGRAVPDAMVKLDAPTISTSANTDREGAFETSFNAPVRVTLRAERPGVGWATGEAEVTADSKPLRLVLAPFEKVSGRVVDADGKPAAGVEVYGIAMRSEAKNAELLEKRALRLETMRSIARGPRGFLLDADFLPYLTRSGADGGFSFETVGAVLVGAMRGLGGQSEVVPVKPGVPVTLVLSRGR